ncbi:MAG TPA: BadF/BadG/BcrA/BcrD ATPase family protein [Gemmatimonadales bacterium]
MTARSADRPTAYIGVDAGGSHTAVVIGDAALKVLARAEGPASRVSPGAAGTSAAVIVELVRRAAKQADCALPAAGMVIGAAGAGREAEQRELEAALEPAKLADQVRVIGDGEIALTAAFGPEAGILVSAGTGSIAYARDRAGRLHRAGGYGWQMGDEGGGYWLGRWALAEAGAARDGRAEGSTLAARLLAGLGLHEFDELVRWAATATPMQVAGLAPHVLNAAVEGEVVARRAVDEAALALAALVGAALAHFPGADPVAVATGGGLLRGRSPVLDALRSALARLHPRARLSAEPFDPAAGALRLAADAR